MYPLNGPKGYVQGFDVMRATRVAVGAGSLAVPSVEIGASGVGWYYNSGVLGVGSANAGGTTFYIDSTGPHNLNLPLETNQGFAVTEMTAPTGTANTGRIFAVDSGGGKTILKVIFGSGAAQTLATEP